jgi:hypothetical protein
LSFESVDEVRQNLKLKKELLSLRPSTLTDDGGVEDLSFVVPESPMAAV